VVRGGYPWRARQDGLEGRAHLRRFADEIEQSRGSSARGPGSPRTSRDYLSRGPWSLKPPQGRPPGKPLVMIVPDLCSRAKGGAAVSFAHAVALDDSGQQRPRTGRHLLPPREAVVITSPVRARHCGSGSGASRTHANGEGKHDLHHDVQGQAVHQQGRDQEGAGGLRKAVRDPARSHTTRPQTAATAW
jgi:hypothetical protein